MIRKIEVILLLLMTFGFLNLNAQIVYQSETLLINKVSEHVYEHTSFMNAKEFGKVSCNGMIVACNNEAVIFDTPADDETSRELIEWVTQSLKCQITAVVATHYHADNLGGLKEFHRHSISSYAYNKTIQMAKEFKLPVPQNGFNKAMDLKVGSGKVHVEFFGEGHTCDNVVGYFPLENILFGGCLIKESGAGKGNLAEANVKEWSGTVRKIKMKYPNVKKIIVGHGKSGGKELLDYTIDLFENRNMQIDMETKKALLIIDIQNDYFEGGANPLNGSLEASINAKRLLTDFRSKSLPVVHIQHFSTRPGSTFFIPNTNGVEIHENVRPVNDEKVIAKNYPNSFRETVLLDYLQSNGITDLVICGMMTQMCVDATTRAAKDFGFTCEVIGDACATKDLIVQGESVAASEVQKSFLAALNYFYSTVKNTNEYLDEIIYSKIKE